jgi:hypothetical protein
MPKPLGYYVNLPKGQITAEPGDDDANKNELLAFLKNEELTKQYAEKEGVERVDAGAQTMEEIFSIDLPNGIFKADIFGRIAFLESMEKKPNSVTSDRALKCLYEFINSRSFPHNAKVRLFVYTSAIDADKSLDWPPKNCRSTVRHRYRSS